MKEFTFPDPWTKSPGFTVTLTTDEEVRVNWADDISSGSVICSPGEHQWRLDEKYCSPGHLRHWTIIH